jgi:hypothetical protein
MPVARSKRNSPQSLWSPGADKRILEFDCSFSRDMPGQGGMHAMAIVVNRELRELSLEIVRWLKREHGR